MGTQQPIRILHHVNELPDSTTSYTAQLDSRPRWHFPQTDNNGTCSNLVICSFLIVFGSTHFCITGKYSQEADLRPLTSAILPSYAPINHQPVRFDVTYDVIGNPHYPYVIVDLGLQLTLQLED